MTGDTTLVSEWYTPLDVAYFYAHGYKDNAQLVARMLRGGEVLDA